MIAALSDAAASLSSLPATNAKAFAQGSNSGEAIHASASGELDCFAALTMTA